jgi:hypothetical protein
MEIRSILINTKQGKDTNSITIISKPSFVTFKSTTILTMHTDKTDHSSSSSSSSSSTTNHHHATNVSIKDGVSIRIVFEAYERLENLTISCEDGVFVVCDIKLHTPVEAFEKIEEKLASYDWPL